MIKIRQATISDIEQLSLLFNNYRIFYKMEPDLEGAKSFLSERILNHQSVVYIAVTPDEVLSGFIQLYPVFSSTRMKRLWLLNDLYVKPEFRGQHLSELLITHAKQLAIETDSCGLMLETAQSNQIGNQLYLKTNFILDSSYNHYYWNITPES